MKSIFYIFVLSGLLSISACGHKNAYSDASNSRQPASGSEELDAARYEERMLQTYNSIMSRENPGEALAEYIQRAMRIYFRTTYYIQQFDEELRSTPAEVSADATPFLMRSENYVRIQAARQILDRIQDKIVWLYIKLNSDRLEAAKEAQGRAEISQDFQRLSSIRRQFHDTMRVQSANEGGYAIEILNERLLDAYVDFSSQVVSIYGKESTAQSQSDQVLASIQNHARELRARLNSKTRFGQYRESIQRRVIEAGNDRELTQEIDSAAESIRRDFTKAWSETLTRIPAQASKSIFPSTGPNGNIVGRNFPSRTWSLTYDDGPHASHSNTIMNDLEAAGFRGTFFWLGRTLRGSKGKDVLERARRNKHVLANHSETHADLSKAVGSNANPIIQREIVGPHELMKGLYGYAPNIYRCPYGSCTKTSAIRQTLADMGYVHAFWAIDTLDWNKSANPNGAASITERVRQQMDRVGQGVILYHDIHPQSVESSASVVKLIRSRGDRHVDLCRAIDETNGDWPVGQNGRYVFCPYMN